MDPINQQEWIERYLAGELQGAELRDFEEKRRTDPAFAEEVAMQQEIADAITETDILDLSKKIRRAQNANGSGSISRRIAPLRFFLQIAAGVAILLVAYLVFDELSTPSSPQELAEQAFTPETTISHLVNIERSMEVDSKEADQLARSIDSLWVEVDRLYQHKSYEEALTTLATIQQQDKTFSQQSINEFFFYRGYIRYLTGSYQEAIADFEKVEAIFTEKASWYKTLAYLQLGQVDAAQQELEAIQSIALHPFRAKAGEVLEYLKAIH